MSDEADTPATEPVDRHGQATDRARDRTGIIAFMAKNGVAANLLMLFMIVAGLFSYSTIVQEVFPEASLDAVSVSVTYPGATPEEIEESIVQKVEEAVQSIEGVKKVSGTAAESIGTVVVEFQLGTDMRRALDDVKSEIDQIQTFPLEAEEPDVRELSNRRTVMKVAIFGDVPERTLKEAAYQLEDALSARPEISFVQTNAVRDYRVYIDVPQERLEALGLSLNDVARTVAASSLDTPAGSIETASEEVRVRTVGQNYDQQDFESVVLRATPDGRSLTIGDIASVDDSFEDADLVRRFNNRPMAFVDVYSTGEDRVLDIAAATKEVLAEEFDGAMPPGVSYAVWDDYSIVFNDRLSLLLKNAAIGLVLVVAALTMFLNFRLAFWAAVGIGSTFVGAIFILDVAGASINMFSLFGFILALGLVVDDAVVVGENVYAERERGRTGIGAAIAGSQRVRLPVIFAVATTIVAFSPLMAITGAVGSLLGQIPLVVIAVLALSLTEALLILPHHLSTLPPPGFVSRSRVANWLERVQEAVDVRFQAFVAGPLDRALRFAVDMPYLVLAGALALLIVMFAMVPAGLIKFEFFPEIESDVVTATLEMPAGTNIEATSAMVDRIEAAGERALARLPESARVDADHDGRPDALVASYTTIGFTSQDGGPGGIIQTVRPNLANVRYSFIPSSNRDFGSNEFEEMWREELGEVPEARSLSITSTFLSLGGPVNIRLSHPDSDRLDEAAARLMAGLGQVAGVFDIESDQDEGMQEIELHMKPTARSLGMTVQELAGQVRAAFFGAEAVRVQRGREEVRVYVRLPEDERDSIADIANYKVRTPGGQVPVGALANISFGQAPSVIRREDGHRITTVTADVDTETVTGAEVNQLLVSEIMPALQADYPDLQYSLGGEQEEQQESFGDLGKAFLMALVGIYALLAIPFRSYVQPLIIMAAIPFGMIGALLGHLILGISLGLLSVFGLIALSGVVINGSLVLIDFMNENLANGMERKEAIVDAAKTRFRPIALTAVTTFLGVAPITFETSLQAKFLIPMATSLGFGVLFGTALMQLVIPALAILQMRAADRFNRLLGREPAADDSEAGAAPA